MTKDSEPADDSLSYHDETGIEATPTPLRAPGKALRGQIMRKAAPRKVTTLMLTSRTCKWPFGDPATDDFHYCGQPPEIGRPYCRAHGSMSYQTPQRKKSS
jgi:hypothetical protein